MTERRDHTQAIKQQIRSLLDSDWETYETYLDAIASLIMKMGVLGKKPQSKTPSLEEVLILLKEEYPSAKRVLECLENLEEHVGFDVSGEFLFDDLDGDTEGDLNYLATSLDRLLLELGNE
jgi:hypothetical protein